jgi:hypothetical protein
MITMPRMRKFDVDSRIHGASLPEILQELDRVRVLLRRNVRIGGRQVAPGPFVNAIVVWFLDLDPCDQAEVFRYGRDRLEELLAMEEPMEAWVRPKVPPPKPGAGNGGGGSGGGGNVKPSARGSLGGKAKPDRRRREG